MTWHRSYFFVCVELNVWDVGKHRQCWRTEDGYDLYHWRHPTLVPVCVLRLTGRSTDLIYFCVMAHLQCLMSVIYCIGEGVSRYESENMHSLVLYSKIRLCQILHCGRTCHLNAVFFIWLSTVLITQPDVRHKNSHMNTVIVMLDVQCGNVFTVWSQSLRERFTKAKPSSKLDRRTKHLILLYLKTVITYIRSVHLDTNPLIVEYFGLILLWMFWLKMPKNILACLLR